MSTIPPVGPESAPVFPAQQPVAQPPQQPVAQPPQQPVGQPAQPQPSYAAQPPYAAQQSYPPQPSYAAQPPYAAPAYYAAPPAPPRPRTLGAVSMAIALAVFVLSLVASAYIGASSGPYSERTATSFTFNSANLTPAQAAAFAPIGILLVVQVLLGTVLGILALVLGIVAVATKRGRPFGIVGIIAAAAAPILSFALYTGMIIATLPPA